MPPSCTTDGACALCRDVVGCGGLDGCRWTSVGGGACVERTHTGSVVSGMALLASGWIMATWTMGWARKNCGTIPRLRRSGQRLKGLVLEKDCSERTVAIGSWPTRATVFAVRCQYTIPGSEAVTRIVQLERKVWEQLQIDSEVEIVVDPTDPGHPVSAALLDEEDSRFGWMTLTCVGIVMVPAMIIGGILVMMDAYGCAGKPDCCPDPAWTVEQAEAQQAANFTLPCDGLGGRTYFQHCSATCNSDWMTWMMMASMFGIMSSFMIVLFRNQGGPDEDNTSTTSRFCIFCFGAGEFCAEENLLLRSIEVIKPKRPRPRVNSSKSSHQVRHQRIRRALQGPVLFTQDEQEALRAAPVHLMDRSLSYHHNSELHPDILEEQLQIAQEEANQELADISEGSENIHYSDDHAHESSTGSYTSYTADFYDESVDAEDGWATDEIPYDEFDEAFGHAARTPPPLPSGKARNL